MSALGRMTTAFGSTDVGKRILGLVHGGTLRLEIFSASPDNFRGAMGGRAIPPNTVQLYFNDADAETAIETTLHEFGHVVDWHVPNRDPGSTYWSSSSGVWRDAVKDPNGAVSAYALGDIREDFAETFVWYVEANSGNAKTTAPGGSNLRDPDAPRQQAMSYALTLFGAP